jgi:hypothetical protein
MTLWTVSNQGFTVHNHTCGINFLSHLRGAPQNLRQTGMIWDIRGGGREGWNSNQQVNLVIAKIAGSANK